AAADGPLLAGRCAERGGATVSAPDPRTVAAETLAFFYATRHDVGSNPLGRAADSAARISADETFRGGPLALVYAQAYRLLSDRAMRLALLHAKRIDRA